MSGFAHLCLVLAYGLFAFDAGCRLILARAAPEHRPVALGYIIIAGLCAFWLILSGGAR